MGLLSGLEKFGLGKHQRITNIKQSLDDNPQEKKKEQEAPVPKGAPSETEFLLVKQHVCPVCDAKIRSIAPRGTKLRRLEPDADLRPRYQYVDVIKYDTVVCNSCGYAAMGSYFEPLSTNQVKRLREQVMARFRPQKELDKETFTYEEAIERYQLCLVSAMVKNAKISEKAYICLKTAWLYRELIAGLDEGDAKSEEKRKEYQTEYDKFYRQAYEGFTQAISTEMPPICGMNSQTLEYLIAHLAAYFDDKVIAQRYIGSLLVSKQASSRMKDRCRELKEKLDAS